MSIFDQLKDEGFLISPRIIGQFKGDINTFIDFLKKNQPEISIIDERVIESFNNYMKSGFASNIRLINNYEQTNDKRDINNWLGYYNKRYDILSSLISKRVEMKPVISISRADKLISRKDFGIIGLVSSFRKTNNDNYMLELEDPTGTITLLVSKSSTEYSLIEDLVPDEIIGVNVHKNGRWVFVDRILFPEVPIHESKKCDDDSCAVFISDSHVGSNNFLPDAFQKFFDWLNGERGSEKEKALASKVKYLFYTGDLVDGVGVYPNQEEELEIKDINKQYKLVAEYLKQVPSEIKIIITPGNHDATRLALPQPPLINEFTREIKLPNTIFTSNPATVNIHSGKGFNGYDVLTYHGNSFDYFIGNVPTLRKAGYTKPTTTMEYLLRKRHLSPTHGATMVAPTIKDDFLLIKKVPDIFVTGHVHQSGLSVYKGITLLNSSCFQSQSDFMKRVGLKPNPGKIPVMSLRNKNVYIMDFMK